MATQTDAENGKAMSELNSALGSLKFELKEKLLSLESAAAQQANNAKEAASAQAALEAMRAELQQAEHEAEEATQMLKMKEIAWEEERKRLMEEKPSGAYVFICLVYTLSSAHASPLFCRPCFMQVL